MHVTVRLLSAGFSHTAGEKGARCSSNARAWNAFSTLSDSLVSSHLYSCRNEGNPNFLWNHGLMGIPSAPDNIRLVFESSLIIRCHLPTVSQTPIALIGTSPNSFSRIGTAWVRLKLLSIARYSARYSTTFSGSFAAV